jgi:hypothetical protein
MKIKLVILQLLLLIGVTAFAQQRGRVKIQDGTIVTDKGTLLRGAHWSTSASEELSERDEKSGAEYDPSLCGML